MHPMFVRYVQAFGGVDATAAKAAECFEQGDLRFAAELASHAVFADPGNVLQRSAWPGAQGGTGEGDSVQQPGIRADHPDRGPGVDEDRLVQVGSVEQAPQFLAAGRVPDGRDKLSERLGKTACRHPAVSGSGRRGGRKRGGECRVDLADVEAVRTDGSGIDLAAEDATAALSSRSTP